MPEQTHCRFGRTRHQISSVQIDCIGNPNIWIQRYGRISTVANQFFCGNDFDSTLFSICANPFIIGFIGAFDNDLCNSITRCIFYGVQNISRKVSSPPNVHGVLLISSSCFAISQSMAFCSSQKMTWEGSILRTPSLNSTMP